MIHNDPELDLRYDFSPLSKSRLRVYNMLVEELEHVEGVHELSDDDLGMLAAAANVMRDDQYKFGNRL